MGLFGGNMRAAACDRERPSAMKEMPLVIWFLELRGDGG
jgi:hypothetical protein